MNLVTGTVTDDGHLAAGDLRLPMPDRAGIAPGRKITYGLRPEHLMLAAEGIVADVAVIEPTGSETHLILRTGGHELVAVSRDRVGLRPRRPRPPAPHAGAGPPLRRPDRRPH